MTPAINTATTTPTDTAPAGDDHTSPALGRGLRDRSGRGNVRAPGLRQARPGRP